MMAYEKFWDIPHPFRVRLSFSDKRANGTAACPLGAKATFSLVCHPALGAREVTLILYCDQDLCKLSFTLDPKIPGECYAVTLDTQELGCHGGLFYFRFAVNTVYGTLYTDGDFRTEYPRAADHADGCAYQLLLYRGEGVRPVPYAGGTMYQILVDRFRRKDGKEILAPRPDAEYEENWEADISQYGAYPGAEVKNNLFYGGSLWGVIEKLDYLEGLGVDTLYLCPVFEAYSNHKYDTGDYMRVDDSFGGDEALSALFAACQKRGMRVILDGVFNHTGADSRYFNKFGHYDTLGAYQSPESPYASWYDFTSYPEEYRCWWGVKILPAVKGNDSSFRKFIAGEGGVVEKYMRMGAAGFRLDVVDELSEELLRDIRRRVKTEREDGFLIGEVWEDASNKIAYGRRRRYFQGEELDSVMNYPMKDAVIRLVLSGEVAPFAEAAGVLYRHYPKDIGHSLMNFLGTHDTERILTVLSGEDLSGLSNRDLEHYRLSPEARAQGVRRLKQAYAVLAFLPGVPCIYYGDEAGVEGGRDPFNRRTYPWGKEDGALLAFFRRVGALRKQYREIFAQGDMTFLVKEGGHLLAKRSVTAREGEKRIYLAANFEKEPWQIPLAGELRPQIGEGNADSPLTLASGQVEWLAEGRL